MHGLIYQVFFFNVFLELLNVVTLNILNDNGSQIPQLIYRIHITSIILVLFEAIYITLITMEETLNC